MLKYRFLWRVTLIIAMLLFTSNTEVPSQTVRIPPNNHIWPADQPTQQGQTSSQQHGISGVLCEFRTDPNHWHAGVDILMSAEDNVYSVMADLDWVYEVAGNRVSICQWFHFTGSSWDELRDGVGDTWFSHRYKHVEWDIHPNKPWRNIDVQDKIVWDTAHEYRWYENGLWYYPQNHPIAKVEDTAEDHLHFEEICYDDYYPHLTDGYFNYNPLIDPLLNPFVDNDDPVIEQTRLYPQGKSDPVTEG